MVRPLQISLGTFELTLTQTSSGVGSAPATAGAGGELVPASPQIDDGVYILIEDILGKVTSLGVILARSFPDSAASTGEVVEFVLGHDEALAPRFSMVSADKDGTIGIRRHSSSPSSSMVGHSPFALLKLYLDAEPYAKQPGHTWRVVTKYDRAAVVSATEIDGDRVESTVIEALQSDGSLKAVAVLVSWSKNDPNDASQNRFVEWLYAMKIGALVSASFPLKLDAGGLRTGKSSDVPKTNLNTSEQGLAHAAKLLGVASTTLVAASASSTSVKKLDTFDTHTPWQSA